MTLAIFKNNKQIPVSKPWTKKETTSSYTKLPRLSELKGNYIAEFTGVEIKSNSKDGTDYAEFKLKVVDPLKSEIAAGTEATYTLDLLGKLNITTEKVGIANARIRGLIATLYGLEVANDGTQMLQALEEILPSVEEYTEDSEWEGNKITRLKYRVIAPAKNDLTGVKVKVSSYDKKIEAKGDAPAKTSSRVFFEAVAE
jgi:hypothetical protein